LARVKADQPAGSVGDALTSTGAEQFDVEVRHGHVMACGLMRESIIIYNT
jgi:hypothetical protein